jgi:hypothetical protein
LHCDGEEWEQVTNGCGEKLVRCGRYPGNEGFSLYFRGEEGEQQLAAMQQRWNDVSQLLTGRKRLR